MSGWFTGFVCGGGLLLMVLLLGVGSREPFGGCFLFELGLRVLMIIW